MPSQTTKRRTTTNFKTKKTTRSTRKSKSNNQGVKEKTFIQTGRRDGDRKLEQRGLMAKQQLEDYVGKMAAGSPTFACE